MSSRNQTNAGNGRPLRELAPLPNPLRPSWWWLLLMPLALIAYLLWASDSDQTRVHTLAQLHLSGHRSPGPRAFVFLMDESGSFHKYEQIRESMLNQILQWAPANLRPADTIAIVGFSGDAYLKLRPTHVASLSGAAVADQTPTDSTEIQPALQLAVNTSAGQPTTLVAVTDTLIDDADASSVQRSLATLNVTDMSAVIPASVNINPKWNTAFDFEQIVKAQPGSAAETALALGHAIAHGTQQKLIRN